MFDNPSNVTADSKQQLIQLVNDELGNLKRRISEIKSQITTQQTMVDREEQRNTDIAAGLVAMRQNIDTTPREDIRDRYDSAMEARQRLATMRGQLERFQAGLELMNGQLTLLQTIAGRISGVDISADDLDSESGAKAAVVSIKRIVEAQEQERQRLARQMHDGPAQSLTNFILQADICSREFDRDPERASDELSNLKDSAKSTLSKVRDFIFDLRPMMLDDLGLLPTLKRYTSRFKDRSDLEIEFEVVGEERRLEDYRQILIFRGIQELIVHGRDYASASNVRVRMDITGDPIKVLVEDDGRGFDVLVMEAGDESKMTARMRDLITMRDKFELVRGTVVVQSSEDGTQVRLELPAG
ncbi:MAG: hypothetical protein IT298_02355 [Chloroflexi bacterium]|jgi:two-component system sensor histidine kinase DegS|nr:MAG: putative two-component sensor histidine kinase [Chloroflexi bacterium OLB13]MBC6957315.1 hypothetical protein [Chloroflexota bacterium]MBV6437997.1 Signal transduction histidine-protein kinase/phosphatase DegS [Anaerolineae bacterium]MDL1916973.1 hypothetical protein [Anaerolineae bacterium CFX4]OQY85290.1 MAG: hypothetical protein B6D42_03620 [Anaerolineae bacterium UTCFX5]